MNMLAIVLLATITPNDPGIMGGEDSASIQAAVDAAQKSGGGEVVIPAFNARTGKAGWEIARSIRLPSGMTVVIDNATLRMKDGVYENFFRSANVWVPGELTADRELHDIRILGRGRAVLDGGRMNDLCEPTSCRDGRPHVRANMPIHFVNVRDFEVSGLRIENHRYWGMCYTFCRRGVIRDICFVARYDRRNQDGINLRNGSREIVIENISGQTGDDTIALSAIDRRRDDAWNTWVEGKSPDIENVIVRNVRSAAVRHPVVAIRAQNGAKVRDVTLENISDAPWYVQPTGKYDLPRYAVIRLGEWHYLSSSPSALGDIRNITIRNVTCRYSDVAVVVNTSLQDAYIGSVKCYGPCAGVLTTEGPGWGGAGATLDNVTVADSLVESDAPKSFVVDDAYVGEGDFLRDFRIVNSTVVRNGRRELVRFDSRDSGAKVEPVALEECVRIRKWNGLYFLAPDASEGSFTTKPFHPDSDDPEMDWEYGGTVSVECSTAPDADGRPGEWSEFRQVVRASRITCPKGAYLRYRVVLRRDGPVEPHFILMLVGETKQTRWEGKGLK